MRISELLRLVIINLSQNKFKVILTSVGIIVGSATIMMVLAIGTGGKLEVAEQFKNLNAGAIDISYESNAAAFGSREKGNKMPGGGIPGGAMPNGGGMRVVVPSMNDFLADGEAAETEPIRKSWCCPQRIWRSWQYLFLMSQM